MRDLTLLIAHPDDEVIFGWPVIDRIRTIVCCSSDRNNPERQWCRERSSALKEVAEILGVEVACFDFNSEFYRVNARSGELTNLVEQVLSILPAGEIFTHNPWGEYGHLDHILVHQIARASGRKISYSDICLKAGWLPVAPWPVAVETPERFCVNNLELYNKLKAVYDKYGCWTWSQAPVLKARILC